MQNTLRIAALAAGVALLGACTTLSEQDRALLTTASKNSEDAKAEAARAAMVAQQALDASRAAQTNAASSAADAKAANEKADRMFQRSLRK
jgi:hypothetical protein